jgi:hypothetical protein
VAAISFRGRRQRQESGTAISGRYQVQRQVSGAVGSVLEAVVVTSGSFKRGR